MSNAFLRNVAAVLFVLAFFMGVWLAVPTRLFFAPQSARIDGYQVTVTRTFPLSDHMRIPVIRYREVVRPLSGELPPCIDTAEFRYQDNGQPAARWDIEPWAARCMTGDYLWRAVWSARLFGVIPLRPVELELLVTRE